MAEEFNVRGNGPIYIVIGVIVVACGLVAWMALRGGAECGDGICDLPNGETETSCAADCPGEAEKLAALKAEEEAKATAKAEEEAKAAAAEADAKASADAAAEEPPGQPEGRCSNPEFLKIIGQTVARCRAACRFDESNPLIGLDQQTFEVLFGQADDAGVKSHFSMFGCNRYGGGRDCLGFDSFYADPAKCPDGSKGENCQKYAGVIKNDFWKFLNEVKDFRYIILLGTASRSGNDTSPKRMSEENQELALKRSEAVQEVLEVFRIEQGTKAEALPVVLDNESQDYESPTFMKLITDQLAASGATKADRGFEATGKHAVNRSVMAVAINCDVTEVLETADGKAGAAAGAGEAKPEAGGKAAGEGEGEGAAAKPNSGKDPAVQLGEGEVEVEKNPKEGEQGKPLAPATGGGG